MADLSRETSHQSSLSTDEATSLTYFPNLSSSALSQDYELANQPLHDLLEGSGPSMFDDNTALDASDPQTLSAASTDVIQNIIDHHGAVELIRRLSTMLAERDAHITALTRLAEEYKIPRTRINDTASRAKQAERRRLSLATASEDLAPSSGLGSESGVCPTTRFYQEITDDTQESQLPERTQEAPVVPKGITKLFGGGGTRRLSKATQKP
jgi:hypothetical protein